LAGRDSLGEVGAGPDRQQVLVADVGVFREFEVVVIVVGGFEDDPVLDVVGQLRLNDGQSGRGLAAVWFDAAPDGDSPPVDGAGVVLERERPAAVRREGRVDGTDRRRPVATPEPAQQRPPEDWRDDEQRTQYSSTIEGRRRLNVGRRVRARKEEDCAHDDHRHGHVDGRGDECKRPVSVHPCPLLTRDSDYVYDRSRW
jgi:hypothetical protein